MPLNPPTLTNRLGTLAAKMFATTSAEDFSDLLEEFQIEIRRQILGDDANPSSLVIDASAYRYLSEGISATMTDPGRWDGDESEEVILLRYVQQLAAARPSGDR